MESVTYYVGITGRTWGGFDSELELSFDTLPTRAMVNAKSGDFESYQISYSTKVTTIEALEGFDIE